MSGTRCSPYNARPVDSVAAIGCHLIPENPKIGLSPGAHVRRCEYLGIEAQSLSARALALSRLHARPCSIGLLVLDFHPSITRPRPLEAKMIISPVVAVLFFANQRQSPDADELTCYNLIAST